MKSLTLSDVLELAEVNDNTCVSVYLPTHRKGAETLENKDQLTFKQSLKTVREKLIGLATDPSEIENILNPAEELLNDAELWRHMLDTLAVFMSKSHFAYYRIPVNLPDVIRVSGQFYLLPLLSQHLPDEHYLLLTLSKTAVRLYDVDRFDTKEIETGDALPASFLEVAGADVDPEYLQFRSANPKKGSAAFHGHGAKGDRDTEVEQYLREVDKGVAKLIPEDNVPLVLACTEENFGEYAKVNSYKNLCPEPIAGHPDRENISALADKGWQILEKHDTDGLNDLVQHYREANDRSRIGSMVTEIVPAAIHGRVESLFVQQGASVNGYYDPVRNRIYVNEQPVAGDVELLNSAAVAVARNRGKVILLEKEMMPEPNSPVNAIYRY